MPGSVNQHLQNSANPLITKVRQLFSRDLALENDHLRQENQILRRKLGSRVSLTEGDRRILVKYGLRIEDRLGEVISIVKPETLLAWNRQQKQKKWTLALGWLWGSPVTLPPNPRLKLFLRTTEHTEHTEKGPPSVYSDSVVLYFLSIGMGIEEVRFFRCILRKMVL